MARPLPALFLLGAICLPVVAHAAAGDSGEPPVQMANPASVYCIKVGGKLEIRKEKAGEVGYCHLPDGRVVEEWKLFRAENAPKSAK